jgi:uncharacterized membrane protein (UPF0182 family)
MRSPLPVPTLSRRAKNVLGAVGVLIALFVVIGTLTGVYVDFLWFEETGFTDVFWTEIQTRALLFALAAIAMGAIVALNLYLAYRFKPAFRPMSLEQQNLERYRRNVEPRRKLVIIGAASVLAVFAGFTAQGSWQTWLLWRNGQQFGTTDAQFGRDISFFAFDYPFYRFVLGFAFAIVLLSLIATAATHYLFGGIRLQTPGQKLSVAARVHLSVLLGIFVLLKAIAYFLDRYGLVYSDRGEVFTGASYTDVNALLPAKTILMFVAVICAVAMLANILVKNFLLPAIALVLLMLTSLIGVAFPAIMQQFFVQPSANQKEAEFIDRAITATREAYGITDVNYVDYTQDPDTAATPDELRNDTETIPNARLLDPNVLSATFTARQQIRNVYGFPDKLDIDRYTIDGVTQDYVVAVRELDINALTGSQTNWINQHTVFTHGNGFVAAPANTVVAGAEGGEPDFTTLDLPVRGNIEVEQSRIYYGELFDETYSVVGAPEGVAPVEFDRPEGGGGSDDPTNSTYDGEGGVSVGSLFRQLVFAIEYRERNFLLSGELNDESRVMYVRDPRDRVEKAAPFLEVDGDPYPAVIDGRIVWIIDGYTTLNSYPYSLQQELGEVTQDSLTGQGTTALANDQVNYIRNSVKATVDAHDGTVTLYEFDTQDPVLATWMQSFPDLITPESEISDELREHFRYPEDLFKVQRELLTTYHVDDPVAFFNNDDFWQVPDDPTDSNSTEVQPPYYILAQRPGDAEASFQLTSALNALERENLSAFVSASSDPETYGELQVLRLPGDTPYRGPQQVQQSFITNNEVRPDLTLFDSDESDAVFGNLLTLPIGDGGLLYIEPLYVQGTGENGFPLLQKVLVNFAGDVGYADTLSEALDQVFGAGAGGGATDDGTTPTTPTDPTTTPAPSTTPAPGTSPSAGCDQASVAAAAADINTALADLAAAQQSGDFAGIGAAQADLAAATTAYQAAYEACGGDSGGTETTPTPTGEP